jgi:hypothetical protein
LLIRSSTVLKLSNSLLLTGLCLNDWSFLIVLSVINLTLLMHNKVISLTNLNTYLIIVLIYGVIALTFPSTRNIVNPFFYLSFSIFAFLILSNSNELFFKSICIFFIFIVLYRLYNSSIIVSFYDRNSNLILYQENYGSFNRLAAGFGILVLINGLRFKSAFIVLLLTIIIFHLVLLTSSRILIFLLCLNFIFCFFNYGTISKYVLLTVLIFMISFILFTPEIYSVLYWRYVGFIEFRDPRYVAFKKFISTFNREDNFLYGNLDSFTMVSASVDLDNMYSMVFFSHGIVGLFVLIVICFLYFISLNLKIKSRFYFFLWFILLTNYDESLPKVEFLGMIYLPYFIRSK